MHTISKCQSNTFEVSTHQIILSINVQFFNFSFNFSSPAVGCKVGSPAGTFEACSMTQCWGYVLLRFLVVLADARGGWVVLPAVVLHPSLFGCRQLLLPRGPGML